ncbi:MAG: peptidylprolyl isomerase [Zoogloeaceae bacterium]|jgi:peptidyl-prolyl cis-trans isomerase C|nr:peptidylprolyl isomerase [Zoogloeaceae bacterium]
MSKSSMLYTMAIISTLVAAPGWAEPKTAAAVNVNGYAISRSVESALVAEQVSRGAQDGPELRQAVRNELIRRALLLREAKKKQLEKQDLIKGQMESASQLVLIRAFLTSYLKDNPATETELRQIYDTFVSQLGTQQYKTRHILLESEDAAKALIVRLDAGENFADLARALSKDTTSGENGGDLGWKVPAAFAEPFGTALKQLEKGKYTITPVQTPSGYHVIYLEDVAQLTPPGMEQLKPQLTERANQQKVGKLLAELLEKARIK